MKSCLECPVGTKSKTLSPKTAKNNGATAKRFGIACKRQPPATTTQSAASTRCRSGGAIQNGRRHCEAFGRCLARFVRRLRRNRQARGLQNQHTQTQQVVAESGAKNNAAFASGPNLRQGLRRSIRSHEAGSKTEGDKNCRPTRCRRSAFAIRALSARLRKRAKSSMRRSKSTALFIAFISNCCAIWRAARAISVKSKKRKCVRDAKEGRFVALSQKYGLDPKGDDLLKFRLAQWQNEQSPYSGERFDMARLLESGYVEVDHICRFRAVWITAAPTRPCALPPKIGKRRLYSVRMVRRRRSALARIRGAREKRLIGWREKFLRRKFGRDEAIEHREKWVDQAESKWMRAR